TPRSVRVAARGAHRRGDDRARAHGPRAQAAGAVRMRAFVLGCILLAACTQKKPAPAAKAAPAPAAKAAPAPGPHVLTGPRQPNVTPRVAPIAPDEVQGLLPDPAGARVLQPVAHAEIGQRIEGGWCFDSGTIADLGAALTRQYAAVGWQELAVHVNPNL